MISITRATKEKRQRDKKRKRYILHIAITGYYDAQFQDFHLTEKEVAQMRRVLNGYRLK